MKLKDIDVHIIAGQSNAVGCTNISTLPKDFQAERFENAYLYQEGNFFERNLYAKLTKGITIGMGCYSGQMGIEYGISKELDLHYGKPFALIRYAFGGSNLYYDWMPRTKWAAEPIFQGCQGFHYMNWSKTIYNGLMSLINEGFNPIIKTLCWMQGESDADKTADIANAYCDNLSDLIYTMRTELKDMNLKVIVGEIATKQEFADIVRAGQKKFCDTDVNATLIFTKDIKIGTDGLHFDAPEDIVLGREFGKAIIKSL